ncbi:unnamed protein product (macronuclear) [Paramecium tetraurelia]|uniref:Uncharacterized protein n=1 Tax=Paramecium tetraurelia TaxID=5888 RepID=A0E3U3_PARTE|nr:uncharacterized protein GSPATT00023133001 [Paramecium tetraurelia]CAK89960.1 unnamed protein product [Paramecium tetraurelia]|eukprot:XP_001457357.1 hypothetical protein (macronuclear) [Paramecium tetraurelia strain d4-2]
MSNKGQFNYFENACVETKSTDLGCNSNLNKNACLQQQRNIDGNEVRCFFRKRCTNANQFHLKKLNCDSNFSIYACVNLSGKKCIWTNNTCVSYNSEIQNGENCETIFQVPVTPNLCAQIQNLQCRYQRISDRLQQRFLKWIFLLVSIRITTSKVHMQHARTKQRCLCCDINCRIKMQEKKNYILGIFINNICRNFQTEDELSCLSYLNKEACLSISNPALQCVWNNKGCQNYSVLSEDSCEMLKNVNPSVCRAMPIFCYYDEINHQCLSPNPNLKQTCTTKGLNEIGCLNYYLGIYISAEGCQELRDDQLNKISCTDSINEEACINVSTPFQYCQWNGEKCLRIPLNQDLDCPLPSENGKYYQVNGNVCQAISKQNIGCKYNLTTKLCERSTGQEICTTPYLNLSACVQISQAMTCSWREEISKCELVNVIDQVTKCTDLKYSNPLACSQISEFVSNKAIGCYFDSTTQQCDVLDNDNLAQMECLQLGLNKYGCTMITKVGQRCRWFRGQCTSIRSKEQIAQVSCIELKYVNPGTCSLVTFNKEVCKYSSDGYGCVNSINSSDTGDYCNTLGLNSFACSQITRNLEGCYFDKVNNVCVLAPDKKSADESVQAASKLLLNTAKCVASSPTQNICIAIETLGEQCTWNFRSSGCEYQYVQFNEKCLDYNTAEKQKTIPGMQISINANVCASILMNYPNKDPTVLTKVVDSLRGYCQFDGKGNCIKFLQTPCTSECCTELVGINAHVCSRFTTGQYCYFNEYNKCVKLTDEIVDTSQIKAVKDYYNFKQYKCSSMNVNTCWMIDWSPTQQCYWDGLVCTQINLSDYATFVLINGYRTTNKYGCQGIEGDKKKTYVMKYYKYVSDTTTCIPYPVVITACETEGINLNVCLGQSPEIYCQWDKINLQCVTIDDVYSLYTCNEFQNKKACVENPYAPCAFLTSTDKCITSPSDINCEDFNVGKDYEGAVNEKACLNITKGGQICQYNSTLKLCVSVSKAAQDSCDLPGINSIGCYYITTANCRWDPINLNCYEEGDNINKQLCLSLLNDNCEWSITNMKCSQVEQLGIYKIETYYNAQACTNLTGKAYYFTATNNNATTQCQILTTFTNKCTDYIMNKQACLLNTKGYKCFFDPNEVPEKKCQFFKEVQLVCSSLIQINIEICMNIPTQCYFEESSLSCKTAKVFNTDKCSTLIAVVGMHYNKMACSSISRTITDKSQDDTKKICSKQPLSNNSQQCYFEKYCAWDENTYGCILQQIAKGTYTPPGQQQSEQCSLSPTTINCSNIYSEAVCLEFGSGCYFDISQGGCNTYTSNLFKVRDCSQINGTDCTNSKTPNAYCKKVVNAGELTDGCEQDVINQDYCENDQSVASKSCSSLDTSTTASDCAQASDACYLNTKCASPTSYENITCASPGVSQVLCLQLNPPCEFSSGSCTPISIPTLSSNGQNYYYICNEVNLQTTNKSEYICGNITAAPCKYSLNSCQNAFFELCSDLAGLTVSVVTCNQCQGFPAAYDYTTNQCQQINSLKSSCDLLLKEADCQVDLKSCYWDSQVKKCQINLHRLNRQSCAQLTTDILAIWDETTNLCEIKTENQIQSLTDCSILSRKACIIPSQSCWINSTTLQCEDATSIMATCQEINGFNAKQQHCLVSNKEPCKWSTTCVSANLASDPCDGLNKYGCLHIQQKLNCAWSDHDKNCRAIAVNLALGCNKYSDGFWHYYYQVNSYICAQLTVGTCYLDTNSNKCTSVGTKNIECANHKGINKLACLTSTIDTCKFDSTQFQCIPTPIDDQQCSDLLNTGKCCLDSLNQVACLSMPNAYCKFNLNVCSTFYVLDKKTPTAATISSKIPGTQKLSPNICDYFNNNIVGAYFIYDTVRLQCINIDKPSPSKYFAQCRSVSISQKGCLEKTNDYCQYENSSCQSMSLDIVKLQKECNQAYNWKTCISINAFCKFQGGKCVPLGLTDTCSNLSDAIVGPQVCAQFPTPCKYNSLTYSCVVVVLKTEVCSSIGLSKSGCLAYTPSQFCIFDAVNFRCTSTYDISIPCADTNTPKKWYINQAKCQFIKTAGNYCQFTPGDQGECLDIPSNLFTGACLVPDVQTNPITCRRATDQPCFYNVITKKCAIGDVNIIPWSLGLSFNKLACVKYDHAVFKVKLIWDDDKGCIELTINDLANIQCSSPVNRLACVSITNPSQFCQFKAATLKCESYDYIIPPLDSKLCAQLTNVNRFEFCQYASDSCVYNSSDRNCVATQPTINNSGDCFNIGMSKLMCANFSSNCNFNDERRFCYGGSIFCKDNTPTGCKDVKTEPCWIVNSSCKGISFQDLKTTECLNAVNQIGCTSISNPQKVCQYDIQTSTCNEIVALTKPCASYTYVSTSKACEFTTDTACKFDFSTKSCKVVSITDVFECDRGLNYLACSTYTRPSLQCKFGKYCYGPTSGISKCADSLNKEVCLNFIYFCTWDFSNSLCIDYNLNGQTCQQLQDQKTVVSSQVCYNAQVQDGSACVFDVYTFTCKIIQPQSCFELESQKQCQSQTELPCLWLNGSCQLFQAVSTDTCQYVGSLGSKNACLSIFRKGQFCQYHDFNCVTYKENYDADNCLNNINKIACVSQQTSSCIWKTVLKEIQEVQMFLGTCEKLENPTNYDCDSALSYKSCLSISKYGQHCRWIKGECQRIEQQSGVVINYNTYQLINQNACGLVNQDKVRYQEQTKSCQLIKDNETVTCKCGKETKGLNKEACLSIVYENCKWIPTQSRCAEYQSLCDIK